MAKFCLTVYASKRFSGLPKTFQKRIIEKLQELKTHDDIFSVVKRLTNLDPATHRLRIGNYRLILELKIHGKDNVEFWVLDAGHRKDIYR